MKSKYVLLSLAFIPALSFADCTLAYGGAGFGNTFQGPTNCTGTVDNVTVDGPLSLASATVNSATVNGTVDANNSIINTLTINGVLKAQSSTIGNITASGNVYLNGTQAGNITVNGNSDFNHYAVYMDDSSVVTGNITFSSPGGVVYESAGAKVSGTITGATIEKQ